MLGATGNPVSRCTFINTRFVTCTTAGVLLANAQDICFIEPEFTNCGYGIQSTSAGANFAVYGGVSTGQTSADCYVSSGGTLILDGHRSAGSNRFLNAAIGTSLCAIKLAACTVAASTNGDGICVQASGAFALTLESCKVFGQISTSEPTAGASLCMFGCGVLDTVPYHNVSGTLQHAILGCQQLNNSGFGVAGGFANMILPAVVAS